MSRFTRSIPEQIASRMPRLNAMAEDLQNAERITKSAAKDFNTVLSNILRDEWSIVVNGLYGIDSEAAGDIIYSPSLSAKNMDKRVGQLQKLLKKHPADANVVNTVIGQTEAIASKYRRELDLVQVFEEKALASQKAKEQEREQARRPIQERVPPATRSILKQVDAVIREHTQPLEDSLRDQVQKRLERYVHDFSERVKEGPVTNLRKAFGTYSGHAFYLNNLTVRDGVTSPKNPLMLRYDVEKTIEEMAKNEAFGMVEQFRVKTIDKLSRVSAGFGSLQEISMNTRIGSAVEGHISVKFEGGTSFDVHSQLVMAISQNGKMFSRYPTTFRNLKRPGEPDQKAISQAELAKISNALVSAPNMAI